MRPVFFLPPPLPDPYENNENLRNRLAVPRLYLSNGENDG
jgi:hypothetical protein